MLSYRVYFAIILLFSVLFGPFWLSAVLALFGIFYFKFFIEGPLLVLISDLLYEVQEVQFLGITTISFIVFLTLFIIIETSKNKFKFHSKLK